MSNLITVSTSNKVEITKIEDGYTLQDLQRLVDGYVEFIDLPDFGLTLIINEEGKINSLPLNLVGSLYFNRQYTSLDFILGDIVLLSSETDKMGNPIGLSDEQVATVLHRIEGWFEDVEDASFERRQESYAYAVSKGRI